MNPQLQEFARKFLKEGLAKLTEEHHLLFKRMYSHKNLDADINDVVDTMPAERLDWAMQQVQNSVDHGLCLHGKWRIEMNLDNENRIRAKPSN